MYVCMCVCVIDTAACVFATDELLKQVLWIWTSLLKVFKVVRNILEI